MSVKRYTYRYNLGGELGRCEEPDGMFVLHSDYAALLARHNALRDAVTTMCATIDNCEVHANEPAISCYYRARAEVDRLLMEASNDGNS